MVGNDGTSTNSLDLLDRHNPQNIKDGALIEELLLVIFKQFECILQGHHFVLQLLMHHTPVMIRFNIPQLEFNYLSLSQIIFDDKRKGYYTDPVTITIFVSARCSSQNIYNQGRLDSNAIRIDTLI